MKSSSPSRVRLRAALGVLLVALGLTHLALLTVPANAETVVGDTIITTDTTWTAAAGPYDVQGRVQVATGATLTIEAGAEVRVRQSVELVGGLRLLGTSTNPIVVRLDAPLFRGIGEYENSSRIVEVRHARIQGPAPIMGANTSVDMESVTVADSTLSDMTESAYLWYPDHLLFERNVFTRVQTLSVGTDHQGTAIFRNNRFRLAPAGGFDGYNGDAQIVAWAAYGAPVLVTGNVFEPSARPQLLEVSIDGQMNATGNYFGSTSVPEVKGWVLDKEDDLNRPGVVPVEPLLASPPGDVPDVPVTAPHPPTDVSAVAGDGQATVSWAAPVDDGGSPITSYTVVANPGGISKTVSAATLQTTVTGLANGTAYSFTVRATNALGTGNPSELPAIVTPVGAPDAPSGVTVARSGKGVVVNWDAPDDNGAPIDYYWVNSQPGGRLAEVYVGMSVVIPRIAPGTYTFTVMAKNRVGVSSPSAPSAPITVASRPDRVAKPTVTVRPGKVTIRWRAPANGGLPITGYRLTVNGAATQVPASPTRLVGRSLRPGTYRVAIAAINAVGSGAASPVLRFRVPRAH